MARRERKFHYIYKTTNLLSGKYYIGMHSTNNLEDGYMGSGTRLKRSLNKHGKENHKVEFLEFLDTRKELKERESEIVNLNEIAKEECMNLKVGGYGGLSNEEHKKAFTDAGINNFKNNKEKRDAAVRLTQSTPEFRKNMSNARKKYLETNPNSFEGRSHTEETKHKISESMGGKGIGNTNSQYGTCWITKDGSNKKIKKEDLNEYLEIGWVKGRELRYGVK
jgi:hypothetical protein